MAGKVHDRNPLVADRDPLKQLAVEIGKLNPLTPIDMLVHWIEQIRDFGIDAIKAVTGIDLTMFGVFLTAAGLDLTHLPPPEVAAQQFISAFLSPFFWLNRFPIGAISSETPNLLAEAIANGEDVWVEDSAGAFHVTANGTPLELISDRIALDVDRTVDASVQVAYSSMAAAVGTSPIRLSWIGWATDAADPTKAAEVAGGDFEVHQPSNPSSSGVTLAGTVKRLASDAWDSVSVVLKVTAGATAGDLVWSGRSAKRPDLLPQNLVAGLPGALAAAGQTIRNAIVQALTGAVPPGGATDANVLAALTSIPATVVQGIGDGAANIGASIQQTIDAIVSGLTGAASANNSQAELNRQASTVALQAQAAEAAAIAAQHALAAMNQGDNTSTGLVKNVTFNGATGDTLSAADWASTGPTAGDMVIVDTSSVDQLGIKPGNPVGRYYAVSTHAPTTDNQAIEAVLGDGTEQGSTYILFHCNATTTAGGALEVNKDGANLRSFTRAGSTWTFSAPLKSAPAQLRTGHRVEVHNTGTVYEILFNNNVVETFVDSGAAIPIGASYRNPPAVIMERSSIWVNAGYPWAKEYIVDSFRIPALLISDYQPSIIAGTGMRAVYTSGTTVSQGTGNVSGSCFNAIAQQSHPGAWSGGAFTVPVAGPWTFEIRLQNNGDLFHAAGNSTSPAGNFMLGMSVNGTVVAKGTPITNPVGTAPGDQCYYAHIDAVRDVFVLNCQAGDVVRPNLVAAPANLSVIGDAGGAGTYFSAWLGRVA